MHSENNNSNNSPENQAQRTQAPNIGQKLINWVISTVASKRFYIFLFLLLLPSIWTGFITDDHFHGTRILAPDLIPHADGAALFDLFSVSDGNAEDIRVMTDTGLLPWWTHPNYRFNLWRPLAEMTHYIDYSLWPHSAWLMHAHHLLWLALLLWMASLFFRRFVSDSDLAVIAFVLFAVSANLNQLINWLACRNTMMAAIFGIATLLAHVKSRETGDIKYRVYALFAFVLALASSEFGLGASTWLFAWTLLLDQGSLFKKFLRLVPYGIIMLGWAVIYVSNGHGSEFTNYYIDPIHSPGEYVLVLLERIPKIIFLALTALPPIVLGSMKVGGSGWIISIAFIAIFLWLIRAYLKKPEWLFLLTGAFLSILPTAAGPSGGRTTAFIALGLLPMVALLLKTAFIQCLHSGFTLRAQQIFAWFFIALTMIGMLYNPASTALYRYNNDKNIANVAAQLPITETDADKIVVLVNPNSISFSTLYPLYRANHQLPPSKSLYHIASGQREFNILRDSENSLIVTPDNGFMVEHHAFFFRGKDYPFKQGDQVVLSNMTVTPLEFTDDGRPLSVRFSFPMSLESDKIKILKCDQLLYSPMQMPLVGNSTTIPACERKTKG